MKKIFEKLVEITVKMMYVFFCELILIHNHSKGVSFMARLFTATLFDGIIDGAGFESSEEHRDVLGRADEIVFSFFVTQVTGAGDPTLTARYLHSNDGERWFERTVLLNAVTMTSPIYEDTKESKMSDGISCALGKLQLTLSTGSAHVKVIACGRGH